CAGVHKPSEGSPLRITGRGSCDAKGQLFAMYTACKELEAEGRTGFGLLILAGEETGSWGAKAFSKTGFKAPFLIVGEPTENKMVSASKGTLSFDLKFTGEAFHSGYPECGTSAVELFNQFYNALRAVSWGTDPELGETTWNIGLLSSPNPQNILSPELTCRLYFRTTFISHDAVQRWMEIAGQAGNDGDGPAAVMPVPASVMPDVIGHLSVTPRGGDTPSRYVVLDGFESAPVAFGSDAPHLTGFGHKIICGPGTVKVAHRPDEHILLSDLETAVEIYLGICSKLL
ncbi:MAG: M20/M25/M40 family metallo-hydrolase, partial [Bacteroidales bacterium]|nr:M20/M25/M40 family metallo-hydrolase [Bacteroidales bacterium]